MLAIRNREPLSISFQDEQQESKSIQLLDYPLYPSRPQTRKKTMRLSDSDAGNGYQMVVDWKAGLVLLLENMDEPVVNIYWQTQNQYEWTNNNTQKKTRPEGAAEVGARGI